ncbi:arf-GAP with GTPase, ANK repeat and PH domain-containing protein 2-like [Nyctibius grandis]|uniref:arf-GAP with GTPase, ANK repeat and PH domain-containing protein 2-like n=1 Tax=Nyctibius grandis TaxID=48427 RepID=UPI0035BC3EF9
MGNSLGCVKEPKEKAAGKAPLSPKKRVRLKRRRRGKRRAMPEAAPQEEPPALGAGEDEEAPKVKAAPRQEGGEEPAGSRCHRRDPNAAALQPGLVVQVKERFQGEVQKARLVPAAAGAAREEGTTVIARLLENPAEKGCEKAVSRLVELQRSGAGSCRAVLLPLRGGTHGHAEGLLSPGSTVAGEEPAKSREPGAGSALGAWGKGGSNGPSSSAVWTCSSTAEPGTVSELSTPSPMVDQLENPSMGRTSGLPSSQAGEGDGHGLPASRSPSSFSGRSGGAARSSSGYGSDPARRPAQGTGGGGTTACPSEGGHGLAAEGPAWRGSAGTDGGTVSVCVYPRPLFGAVWGDLVVWTLRS